MIKVKSRHCIYNYMDNYKELYDEIVNLSKNEKNFSLIYGKSYYGQNLYAFHKGDFKGPQILITAGIHAREYISSYAVIDFLKNIEFENYGVYVLPLLNPDGVKLCLEGVKFINDYNLKRFLIGVNKSEDFSKWKANIRAVDLNVNFDADYGKSKFITTEPSTGGYIGEKANSEIENRKLLEFIENKNIVFSLCYHSKGEVVYYGIDSCEMIMLKKLKKIATKISKVLNFIPVRSIGSSGGLSDYLVLKKNIASLTIELGSDLLSHPIEKKNLQKIIKNQYKMFKFLDKNLIFYI